MSIKVFVIMLTLLVASILTLALNLQPAKTGWTGTVYIRYDGSIYPEDAPITTFDNVTYSLTDDIYGGIVIERSNIIVDGSGFTVYAEVVGVRFLKDAT